MLNDFALVRMQAVKDEGGKVYITGDNGYSIFLVFIKTRLCKDSTSGVH